MANCIFTQDQNIRANQAGVVRRANSQRIAQLEGATVERFVAHFDLIGGWEGADPNRAYAGLVPVIAGTERADLALLVGDLLLDNVPTYDNNGNLVFQTPNDEFHVACRNAWHEGITYNDWFNAIIAAIPRGITIHGWAYTARNQRGGYWRNIIFAGAINR